MAYSVKSAASLLDMHERTIWTLVAAGEIESFKVGKSRRIPHSAICRFIDRQMAAAS